MRPRSLSQRTLCRSASPVSHKLSHEYISDVVLKTKDLFRQSLVIRGFVLLMRKSFSWRWNQESENESPNSVLSVDSVLTLLHLMQCVIKNFKGDSGRGRFLRVKPGRKSGFPAI